MKKFAKQHWMTMSGIVLGATAGYLYWQYVGCSSGTCLITSKPFNSSAYGALLGGTLFSMFQKRNQHSS